MSIFHRTQNNAPLPAVPDHKLEAIGAPVVSREAKMNPVGVIHTQSDADRLAQTPVAQIEDSLNKIHYAVDPTKSLRG